MLFLLQGSDESRQLISNAGGSPLAYMCDECVAACAAIIEDDKIGEEIIQVN